MPRIKRWFPVNHNINRDPEVWVMRREIGEKSLSIWLEILSIADQNEGVVPGDYEALVRSISGTCQAATRTVRAVCQYALSKVWLQSEPTLHVAKYWNYHKVREPIKTPHGNSTGPLPSEPSEPPNLKDPAPAADLSKKEREEVSREIEMILDRLGAIDGEKTKDVLRWVKSSARNEIPYPVVLSSLRKLEPKAKTADEWWPYLVKVGKQEFGRFNEGESSRIKAEDFKFLRKPLASNRHAAGGQG